MAPLLPAAWSTTAPCSFCVGRGANNNTAKGPCCLQRLADEELLSQPLCRGVLYQPAAAESKGLAGPRRLQRQQPAHCCATTGAPANTCTSKYTRLPGQLLHLPSMLQVLCHCKVCFNGLSPPPPSSCCCHMCCLLLAYCGGKGSGGRGDREAAHLHTAAPLLFQAAAPAAPGTMLDKVSCKLLLLLLLVPATAASCCRCGCCLDCCMLVLSQLTCSTHLCCRQSPSDLLLLVTSPPPKTTHTHWGLSPFPPGHPAA